MIRVTHIIKATSVAGAERHLLILLPALIPLGVQPSLIVLIEPEHPLEDYVQTLKGLGVAVQQIVIEGDIDLGLAWKLRHALQALQPDVVHTHLIHADLFGMIGAKLAGIRHVISSRHNDNPFRRRMALRLLHRGLWGMSAGGIGISDSIRQFCIEVEGASPDKLITIHYGIHADQTAHPTAPARQRLREELKLPPNAFIFGYMCRLIEQKGIRYGLEAFAQIAPHYPHAYTVIAGKGALMPSLQAQVADLGLAERVHFLGWRTEPTATLAGYDVLMMPSLWEGFGLVMLEAMANGLPIIGSAVSAIPEVVAHGESGLLVPPRDVDQLAQAMRRLLDEPTTLQAMQQHARARLASHFNADRMAMQTVEFYHRVNHGVVSAIPTSAPRK